MKLANITILAAMTVTVGSVKAESLSPEMNDTASKANCAVSYNADEIRWLQLLMNGKIALLPEVDAGARTHALSGMMRECFKDADRVDFKEFVPASFAALTKYPEKRSSPRAMDALGDCLASSVPSQSIKFLEASDREAFATRKFGALSNPAMDVMLSASKGCGKELDKLNNKIQANDLYFKLNAILR